MFVSQQEEVNAPACLQPAISDHALLSSTASSESSPIIMPPPERKRPIHRRGVGFSNIDVIVLPYLVEDISAFLSNELSWVPIDRYSITVDSMEETRSLVDRFGDDRSALDRFNLIRTLRSRDYTDSSPLFHMDEKSLPVKQQPEMHWSFGNPVILWALILICSHIAFSAPYQLCQLYPSHQALKKILRLGSVKGIETEVLERKRKWIKFGQSQR